MRFASVTCEKQLVIFLIATFTGALAPGGVVVAAYTSPYAPRPRWVWSV